MAKTTLRLYVMVGTVAVITAVIASMLTLWLSQPNPYEEFYDVETAVSVSPSDYVSSLEARKSDTILVDLRTSGEYAKQHMTTAVNIPAPEMDEAQLIAAFRQLSKDKTVITYCYSSYCMLTRKVGKVLADNGIYVKHFTAGWLEIQRDYAKYVVNGTGTATGATCSVGGTFTC